MIDNEKVHLNSERTVRGDYSTNAVDSEHPAFASNPSVIHPHLPKGGVRLTRKITDHHINAFNREHLHILADEKGIGGASHVYSLRLDTGQIGEQVAVIKFQQGPVQDVGFNGVTDEALLAIVLDRLRGFQQGSFPCRENAIAITKIEEALHRLEDRCRDRERRGVEGTLQA